LVAKNIQEVIETEADWRILFSGMLHHVVWQKFYTSFGVWD
jgi:hypothetical protein